MSVDAPLTRWVILTGEYPPQPGGVSDYTHLLACGLAATGDEVHIWVTGGPEASFSIPGVTVRRLPDRFGIRGIAELDAGLRRTPRPFRLLVQYVPHMYGCRAMNLPFCLWLWARCPVRPWVMFHEVAFPLGWHQPIRHTFLGIVHRVMAAFVCRAAERVFLSTPAWEGLLPHSPRRPVTWLPVPSTVTARPDPAAVGRLRGDLLTTADGLVLGHFGTFGGAIARSLATALPPLLRGDDRRTAVLVGEGGMAFAAELTRSHPHLGTRLRATGRLPADEVACYLSACDLLVQPYPDGVTGRRTSIMAGLALGLPVITTSGQHTEPLWQREELVELVPANDDRALIAAAERLLADHEARDRLRTRGAIGYRRYFGLEHTVNTLRAAAGDPWPAYRPVATRD